MKDERKYKNIIEKEREEKDRFFKEHPQSPLLAEDKENFSGLNYYQVKPEYRFTLELDEKKDKKKIEVNDNMGNKQQYIHWGEFKFTINGDQVVLQAYKGSLNEDRLWLPFKDKTNGDETYGAGRYLDLNSNEKVNNEWIVDFNRAYNPFCAYSENYVCPMIPPENWLNIKIEAGEKKFK